jgi:hypothetical protein
MQLQGVGKSVKKDAAGNSIRAHPSSCCLCSALALVQHGIGGMAASFRRAALCVIAVSALYLASSCLVSPRFVVLGSIRCRVFRVVGGVKGGGFHLARKLSRGRYRNLYRNGKQDSSDKQPLGEAGKAKGAPCQLFDVARGPVPMRCGGRFSRFPERPTGGNR